MKLTIVFKQLQRLYEKEFVLGGIKFLTGGSQDVKNQNKTSSTLSLKEWQIAYNCKKAKKVSSR